MFVSLVLTLLFTLAFLRRFFAFFALPYIKGLTEPLSRLLRNNGIQTTSRPLKTLQQEFISPRSRPPADLQTNVVYKIPCADSSWSIIMRDIYQDNIQYYFKPYISIFTRTQAFPLLLL